MLRNLAIGLIGAAIASGPAYANQTKKVGNPAPGSRLQRVDVGKPANTVSGVERLQLTPGRRNVRVTIGGRTMSLRLKTLPVRGMNRKEQAAFLGSQVQISVFNEFGAEFIGALTAVPGLRQALDVFSLDGDLRQIRTSDAHASQTEYVQAGVVQSLSRTKFSRGSGQVKSTLEASLVGTLNGREVHTKSDRRLGDDVWLRVDSRGDDTMYVLRDHQSSDSLIVRVDEEELSIRFFAGGTQARVKLEANATPSDLAAAVRRSAEQVGAPSPAFVRQVHRLARAARAVGPDVPENAVIIALSESLTANAR